MTKKTFATAPRPKQLTANEIDAYEKGGAGHDRAPAPVIPSVARPAERIKRLSLDLPESIHTRFKTACSATGRKMVSELHALIEQRIAELESEGGISHS